LNETVTTSSKSAAGPPGWVSIGDELGGGRLPVVDVAFGDTVEEIVRTELPLIEAETAEEKGREVGRTDELAAEERTADDGVLKMEESALERGNEIALEATDAVLIGTWVEVAEMTEMRLEVGEPESVAVSFSARRRLVRLMLNPL
jgi:hypothetical protein